VSDVLRDPGRQFARVRVMPTALLNKSRHLLLVDMPAELHEAVIPNEVSE